VSNAFSKFTIEMCYILPRWSCTVIQRSYITSQRIIYLCLYANTILHHDACDHDTCLRPALVAEWLTHSAAMCSRAWRGQRPGFDSAWARPPTKELFLIISTHMMNREIIPGRKKEGSTVSSINCDHCRQLDLAVSCLPAAPAWVEANRLDWPLVGVIHSASQG